MDAVAVDHAQLERERLLDTQQCERVVEEILALRAHWTARDESVPFFTLGAASYLDARQSESAYRRQAVELNPLLRERFGWLLERVRDKVSEQTGLLAEWAPAAAVPAPERRRAWTSRLGLPRVPQGEEIRRRVQQQTGADRSVTKGSQTIEKIRAPITISEDFSVCG